MFTLIKWALCLLGFCLLVSVVDSKAADLPNLNTVAPPADPTAWKPVDKALFGGFVGLQVVDTLQTNYVRKHPDEFSEMNSLYGNPPNMGMVIGVKVLVTGLVYVAADNLQPTPRRVLLGLCDVLYIGIVGHNVVIGVKLGL